MASNVWKLYDDEFKKHKKEDVVSVDNCKKCNGNLKIGDNGFYCCSNNSCGAMYKDKVDMGAEWRFHNADDGKSSDPARCGMPVNPLLKESSFGCKISCNSNSSYEMKKIRRYTEWLSMPYKEKAKYESFQMITTYANQAGIPKIFIESAIRYHDQISNNTTYRGLNHDGLLAASVYIAFRANGNSRTAKEIATIFHLDSSSATKGCKNALNLLNDLEEHVEEKTKLETSTPDSFIHRYCSKLGMNDKLTELCYIIAMIVWKKRLISENTPDSISTGIIYYVCQKCDLNISKLDIHYHSKISEVTINKCYKKLESIESKFLPPEIKTRYNIS